MKKLILALTIIALIFGAVSCNGDVDERLFSYTVSFVSNGGTEVESQIVKRSACAEKPENPTFGDYTFNGWFEKGSSTEFNFETPINEDITLYAHWDGVVETIVSEPEEINLTAEKTLSVAVSPVAGDSNTTVVTIPANAITGTGSTSQLSVTSYSIEVSPIAFTILETSGNNLAVAGIDCILKIDDVVVSDFEKPVIVTTYIPKGLSSVEVVYNGDDGKAQPIASGTVENPGTTNIISNIDIKTNDDLDSDELGYSAYTGKLRFMTTHFSEFYVATNAEVYISDAASTDVSAMKLVEFRDAVNTGKNCKDYTVTLLKDVDMAGYKWLDNIGIENNEFQGVFNGNGHTIYNLSNGGMKTNEEFTIASTGAEGTTFGLFGRLAGTVVIKNLTVTVNAVSSTGTGWAGIVGVASGKQCNLTLENLTVKGTLQGKDKVAGIIGQTPTYKGNHSKMTVINCVNEASVTGDRVGGISCSSNHDDGNTYVNCINKGKLTAKEGKYQTAAGIACVNHDEIFTNCKNEGIIDATIGYNIATLVFIEPQTGGSYKLTSGIDSEQFENYRSYFIGNPYNASQAVDWEKVLISNKNNYNQAWSDGYKAGILYDTENASSYLFKYEKGQNFKTYNEAKKYITGGSFGKLTCYEDVTISAPINEEQTQQINIDLNDHKLNISSTASKLTYVNGGTFRISNGTIVVDEDKEYLIDSYTGLTEFDNVSLNYENKCIMSVYAGYTATFNIKNCNIEGYIKLGTPASGVTINGTTYNGTNGLYIVIDGSSISQVTSINP